MKALKCRECGREYPLTATHVCEFDFGPLEVVYDYATIKRTLTRQLIQSRPQTMWRYRELLPVAKEPTVGCQVGFTPLVKADRLARRLGIRELWIKNDTVNYPTLSFKDRVVSVALSRARASSSPRPVTRTCFSRLCAPLSTLTADFATPSASASSRSSAAFASPSTGRARTRAFRNGRPCSSVSQPSTASAFARGVSRTAIRASLKAGSGGTAAAPGGPLR